MPVLWLLACSSYAQPIGWQHLDLKSDHFFGISTSKAYSELLQNKKATTTIVAIIDNGIDTAHQDLRNIIWTNPKEIARNGIDDDKNGYPDDVHGWNFSSPVNNNPQAGQYVSFNKDASGPSMPGKIASTYGWDITGSAPLHGTHIAGIIGAKRNTGTGVQGVADNVKIMSLRCGTTDQGLADAIRYAADNGAKVINISLGKESRKGENQVDNAIQYAMNHDVLIVHAAGNEGLDLDKVKRYPNRNYSGNKAQSAAWIEVGASGWNNDSTLLTAFSNYGKTTVDVFAPGARIFSTTPNNQYAYEDGTSMAAPVVAGLAALIRSYYPSLTAPQVKEIIVTSVYKINHNVWVDLNGKLGLKPFSETSISGGVVNAYNALKMAAERVEVN